MYNVKEIQTRIRMRQFSHLIGTRINLHPECVGLQILGLTWMGKTLLRTTLRGYIFYVFYLAQKLSYLGNLTYNTKGFVDIQIVKLKS